MGITSAREAYEKLDKSTQQHHETKAIVEALAEVTSTMERAQLTIHSTGTFINRNLNGLKETGDATVQNIHSLVGRLQSFNESLTELNGNLNKFDEKATKLGVKANRLAFALFLAAAIQAIATVVLVYRSW